MSSGAHYYQYVESRRACSYVPSRIASLEHRIGLGIAAKTYQAMLCRGWRRFGRDFFRPACPACSGCVSLRLPVARFHPSRSQRRAATRNAGIHVVVQSPTMTPTHLAIFDAYHADMHLRKGWSHQPITEEDYRASFLAGDAGFAREFLYFEGPRLLGVALADVLPTAISSVYFYYAPAWRSRSPGVFSILQQMQYAQRHGLAHHYLGYWVDGCPAMAYKKQYRPHEILHGYPGDEESPVWLAGDEAQD